MPCFIIILGLSLLGVLQGVMMAASQPMLQQKEQTEMQSKEYWIHPQCKPIPLDYLGPFVELSDGNIMTVKGNTTLVSKDDGKTWSEPRPVYEGAPPGIPAAGRLIRARDGVIVLIYQDPASYKMAPWDGTINDWSVDMRVDLWTIRSLDEGKTWVDRLQIPPEWYGGCNGNFNFGIQTKSGHIVFPLQPILHNPGRWGTRTIVSADNGKTWKSGNLIDLGGCGRPRRRDRGHPGGALGWARDDADPYYVGPILEGQFHRPWPLLERDSAEPDRRQQRAGPSVEPVQRQDSACLESAVS